MSSTLNTEFLTLESAIEDVKISHLSNSSVIEILRLVRNVLCAESYDDESTALDELESYCR